MDKTAATALFAWLDREVWLVTSQAGEKRGGLIATFVNQASIVPDVPRVVIGLARHHHTWTIVEESHPHEQVDVQTVRWSIQVPAEGSATLTYRVRVTQG